jgi:hypothetical protein
MTVRFKQGFACLNCGKQNDAATVPQIGESDQAIAPKPGDIAICFRCQHIMAYGDQPGSVRPLTDEEVIDVAGDPEIVKAQNLLGEFWRSNKELEGMLDLAENHVRNVLLDMKAEQLMPVFLMIDRDDDVMIAPAPWDGEEEKAQALKMVRATMKVAGVKRYSIVAEAWTAEQPVGWKKGDPVGPMPEDRPDRKEVVWALAADHKQHRVRVWNIVRGEAGTIVRLDQDKKVKEMPGIGGGRMARLLA